MPRFEVFCPAAPPALASDVTLRVEAEHWLAALRAGLQKVGGPELTSSVLCDVQADGSLHVTDPIGGSVFRIEELGADVPLPPAAGAKAPVLRARQTVPDGVLAELSERVADVSRQLDPKARLGSLLDLAMERVGAESGSVLLVRPGASALAFEVARGPRAKELLALGETVPLGAGIVGFCARENVCLAVSDAERDPRFLGAIAVAIGYETRSLVCAPIARSGRVLGALEVMNKQGGAPFDRTDLAVVSYLAQRAAELVERA